MIDFFIDQLLKSSKNKFTSEKLWERHKLICHFKNLIFDSTQTFYANLINQFDERFAENVIIYYQKKEDLYLNFQGLATLLRDLKNIRVMSEKEIDFEQYISGIDK